MDIPVEFNPEPIGDGDHLMTLAEWGECVGRGGFADHDGYGRLATEAEKSDMTVKPSRLGRLVIPAWATHVVVAWCNR